MLSMFFSSVADVGRRLQFLSPFCQVAGEVLAKADDTPVLSVIDPIKSFRMGQGHLKQT